MLSVVLKIAISVGVLTLVWLPFFLFVHTTGWGFPQWVSFVWLLVGLDISKAVDEAVFR